MKNLCIIITVIIIIIKGLGMAFDHASTEVHNQAQDRLNRLEQVAK